MKPRYTDPRQALCKGLTRYRYNKLPVREKTHFTRCRKCGRYFDRRRLDQMVAHSFLDHDSCSPAAQVFKGFRGRPVRIRKYMVIPIGGGEPIDGAEFDRMRKRSGGQKRSTR